MSPRAPLDPTTESALERYGTPPTHDTAETPPALAPAPRFSLASAAIDYTLPPSERVASFLSFAATPSYSGHDKSLLSNDLTLVSASEGRVEFALRVPAGFANRMSNLHGGAAALVFDVVTTTALVTVAREGWWVTAGVTRSLSVQYYKPVPVGSTVRVVGEVVSVGGRLASITGEIRGEGGELKCTCEHLKVNIDKAVGKL